MYREYTDDQTGATVVTIDRPVLVKATAERARGGAVAVRALLSNGHARVAVALAGQTVWLTVADAGDLAELLVAAAEIAESEAGVA